MGYKISILRYSLEYSRFIRYIRIKGVRFIEKRQQYPNEMQAPIDKGKLPEKGGHSQK